MTMTRSAIESRNSASIPTWLASSTMTTSNRSRSAAIFSSRLGSATTHAAQGAGPTVAVPQRRRRDPDTGRYQRLSQNQRDVNTARARRRGPGERVNAELKNWRILRKIRSSPNTADKLIAAVQTLMLANA